MPEVLLFRHAETRGNQEKRYVGVTDEPLSDAGKVRALYSGVNPRIPFVYSSPMIRAVQTASIKFPNARILCVPGLREMDFGDFEYKTAEEMSNDKAYRAWVDSGCEEPIPGGETPSKFRARQCIAFSEIAAEALRNRLRFIIVIAHGGTIMSVLDRFGDPSRGYFNWKINPCGGYLCTIDERHWQTEPRLLNIRLHGKFSA